MPALSAVLLTFSFQFRLLFCALTQLHVILLDDLAVVWRRNQATVCTYVMPYRKRALILAGNMFSCTQRTAQGKDFELILTLKMETRHPTGGPFSREFSAVVIIAELWRPEVARPAIFLAILRFLKRPLLVKFSQFCPESSYRFNDRRYVQMSLNFADGKSVKSCDLYRTKTKFRLFFQLSLLCGSRPKSTIAGPQHLTHNFPNFIQIGSYSVELQPNSRRPLFWHIE